MWSANGQNTRDTRLFSKSQRCDNRVWTMNGTSSHTRIRNPFDLFTQRSNDWRKERIFSRGISQGRNSRGWYMPVPYPWKSGMPGSLLLGAIARFSNGPIHDRRHFLSPPRQIRIFAHFWRQRETEKERERPKEGKEWYARSIIPWLRYFEPARRGRVY